MSTYRLEGVRKEKNLTIFSVSCRRSWFEKLFGDEDWTGDFIEHCGDWFYYPSMILIDGWLRCWLYDRRSEIKARKEIAAQSCQAQTPDTSS